MTLTDKYIPLHKLKKKQARPPLCDGSCFDIIINKKVKQDKRAEFGISINKRNIKV